MSVPEGVMEGYLVNMMRLVDENGWAVQGVFPRADDPEPSPPFSYTVGLTSHGLPEIIVWGLGYQLAGSVLNDIAERFVKGQPLPTRTKVDEILRDAPVMLLPCKTDDLTMARRLYGTVEALQLVWPDAEGYFPWEEGFDTVLHRIQPVHDL